ncbi:DUF7931 domain-containing protein [Natronospira bacteriovora]|uniref:DUF7931 domain-containing protein n=1 Tax=Natronospira bacteriovora TaxID=3069753 RepID=A0ABU0WAI8_9GAMM|nr:hypothetical protein [Natronospira sp. AB-CW4]MDQ2070783.1 hypothetical protein [Natronospira sp. AB-CW4]
MNDQPGGPLETRDDSRQAARHLAELVRRELRIFTRDMDPAVLDQVEFLEAARQFAIRSQHTRIRVLVQDATRAVKEGHGLTRLAARLSSHVSLHRPHDDDVSHADTFIVADDQGYLYRPLADRLEGRWHAYDPAEARRLARRFDEMWERSKPEPEFRRLGV